MCTYVRVCNSNCELQVVGLSRRLGSVQTGLEQAMSEFAKSGVQASYALLDSATLGLPHQRQRYYIAGIHCQQYREYMGVECDVSSLLDEYPALCDQLQGSVDLGLDLEFAIMLPKDDAAVLEVQERLKPRSEEVDWPLQRKRLPAPKKKGMKRERPLSEDSDNDDADAD